MRVAGRRLASMGLGLLALTGLVGCVAGVGYSGDVGVGYYPGYIEPYGYDYGGWGGDYRVGPPRGGYGYRGGGHGGDGHRGDGHGGGGRAPPSIPSGARGGGGAHGGGGSRGGGGGGHH